MEISKKVVLLYHLRLMLALFFLIISTKGPLSPIVTRSVLVLFIDLYVCKNLENSSARVGIQIFKYVSIYNI